MDERLQKPTVRQDPSNPGAHSEIYAVNDALLDGADIDDLVGFNVWLKDKKNNGRLALDLAQRCDNCVELTADIEWIENIIQEATP